MSAGAAVAVTGVRKSFENGRVQALRDVTFTVEPGELVALTGASGSGKSTLLNLIAALDEPDDGSIAVGGRHLADLRNASQYRAETIGFVFQAHNLLPTLSACENVQIPMFGRTSRRERDARARELLRQVGLESRLDARPAVLSGGERQRVAIARALANEPQLLLADEPTGALDSATGRQVLDLLDEVRRRHRTTIILVTNDEAVAEHADRTLRLRDGVIHAEAPRPVPA